MSKTIWEYPLHVIPNVQVISMPRLAEYLATGVQGDLITMWWLVDENEVLVHKYFAVRGTGHDIDAANVGEYRGTVQMHQYVWHVFEVEPFPVPA